MKFATNEAIQRTEAYEYAQSLGARCDPLPSFQVSGGCGPWGSRVQERRVFLTSRWGGCWSYNIGG